MNDISHEPAQTDMVGVVRWFMGDVVHRLFSFRFSISTRRGSRPCDLVGRFLLGLYPSHIRSAKRGLFALVDVLANPSQLGATWANVGERVASLSSLPLIVALPRLNRTDQAAGLSQQPLQFHAPGQAAPASRCTGPAIVKAVQATPTGRGCSVA